MSFELLKELQPKHRAILFQALSSFQSDGETMLAESYQENINHAQRTPLNWLVENTKEVKQLLFAETFPEDLEPLDYFIQEQKELENKTGNIAGIP